MSFEDQHRFSVSVDKKILKLPRITPVIDKVREEHRPMNLSPSKKQKIVITGDDVLVEYVRRIKKEIKRLPDKLPIQVETVLNKFNSHSMWSVKLKFDVGSSKEKFLSRYKEMKTRRESFLKEDQLKAYNQGIPFDRLRI